MTRKYLAFDIEIAKSIPDDCKDWKAHRPLGISCMATYAQDESGPRVWHPSSMEGLSPTMSREDLIYFIDFLNHMVNEDGYTLLTHNGTSFDFDILAEESGMFAECRELALNAVDTMLHFHAFKGFPVGLDAICRGMGILGKTAGMTGAKAPELWAAGEYQTVLNYVANDVRMTIDVALACEKYGYVCWVTKAGKRKVATMPDRSSWRWLTVQECLALPEPDQSWMTMPMKRSDMTAWMQREIA